MAIASDDDKGKRIQFGRAIERGSEEKMRWKVRQHRAKGGVKSMSEIRIIGSGTVKALFSFVDSAPK
jgi:hypothetical protein